MIIQRTFHIYKDDFPLAFGTAIGGVLSILCWNGHRFASPHTISTFPDLVTLGALPVLVFGVLWLASRRQHVHDVVALRRVGMTAVIAAAVVYSGFMIVLGVFRFTRPYPYLLGIGFVSAFVIVLAIGAVSTYLASWLILRKRRDTGRAV